MGEIVMPTYEYACKACGQDFEVRRRITESRDDVCCPECGSGRVRQVLGMFTALGMESKRPSKRDSGGSSCSTCTATSCTGCSR